MDYLPVHFRFQSRGLDDPPALTSPSVNNGDDLAFHEPIGDRTLLAIVETIIHSLQVYPVEHLTDILEVDSMPRNVRFVLLRIPFEAHLGIEYLIVYTCPGLRRRKLCIRRASIRLDRHAN
jgi:hypothetical protein